MREEGGKRVGRRRRGEARRATREPRTIVQPGAETRGVRDDSKEGNSASFGLKMAVAREGRDETRGFPIARSGGCRPGNPRTRTRAWSLRTVSVRAVAVGARATRAGEASVRTRVIRCSGDLRDWCRLPLSRCAPGRADTRRDLTRATRATRVARPRPRSFLTFLSAGANDATLAGTSTRGRRGDPDRDARRVARGLPSLSTRQHPAGPVPGGPGGPPRAPGRSLPTRSSCLRGPI